MGPIASRTTRRRFVAAAAGSLVVTGFPMLNVGSFRVLADSETRYSARALALVERVLVIDMLAVLKIDFRPEAYANPLTEAEIAAFRSCGITGFHHSIGTGGPDVREKTLAFFAGWHGFVGRHADLFSLVHEAAAL